MHSCVLLGKNYREAKSSLICLIQLYCKEYAMCMCFVGERKIYGGSESRPNCFLVQAGGVYQSWVRPLVAHSEEQQAVTQPCLWSWSIVPEQLSHQSLWAWGGDSQNVCVPKYHLNRTTWNNCLVLDGGSGGCPKAWLWAPKKSVVLAAVQCISSPCFCGCSQHFGVSVRFVSWGKEAAAESGGRHKKIMLVVVM